MGAPDDAESVLGAVIFPAFQIPVVVQMEEEQRFYIKERKRENLTFNRHQLDVCLIHFIEFNP